MINKIFNSNITKILLSFITYAVFCINDILPKYNIYSWIILFLLIIISIKTEFYNKYIKSTLFFSIVFSILTIYGKTIYEIMDNKCMTLFKALFTINNLFLLLATFYSIFIIMCNLIPKLLNFKIMDKDIFKIRSSKIVFILSFLIILVCWIPYFLRFFPGTLSPDSISELSIIENNFSVLSDHHPLLHVLFIAVPYIIGKKFFGSIAVGVAFYTITQMICMSAIFASVISFLYKRNVNNIFLILVLLFYSIMPMHGYYSIVMWKDIIFAGFMVLFTMECIKLYERYIDNSINFKNMKYFIVISVFCVFFRNNGIYMYMFVALISIKLMREYWKVLTISFAIVFAIYYGIKGPIFSVLDVEKSNSAEYVGIPLQQIGRMAFKNVDFTENEQEIINNLIPISVLGDAYNPKITDSIKFNEEYNNEYFDQNKLDFFKLWLSLCSKHPIIALEAYSASTLGYWYPGVEYWSTINGIDYNSYGLSTTPHINEKIGRVISKVDDKDIPILNIEWSIGLCFWIISIFAYIAIKKKRILGIYPYLPIIGVWLTMLVASPVFGEFRYVYNAFACLPLLMLFPYLKDYIKK